MFFLTKRFSFLAEIFASALTNSHGLTADDRTKLMEIYNRFKTTDEKALPTFQFFPCH